MVRERVKPVRMNGFSHQKMPRASIPLVASGERCWYWDSSMGLLFQPSDVNMKTFIATVKVKRAELMESWSASHSVLATTLSNSKVKSK